MMLEDDELIFALIGLKDAFKVFQSVTECLRALRNRSGIAGMIRGSSRTVS